MLKEVSFENFYQIKWLDKFMVGHRGTIAGGCFKNIFNGEKVKDLDIFFENSADYEAAVKYFDGMCGEDNSGGEYHFYYQNKKVKAYKHAQTNITIELISHIFGRPEWILSQFDFTITKFAYAKREVIDEEVKPDKSDNPFGDSNQETKIEYFILHDENYFEHLHLKRLVTDDKILYPASTFDRMFKYAKYGYFPCIETKTKVIQALRNAKELDDISKSLYDGID